MDSVDSVLSRGTCEKETRFASATWPLLYQSFHPHLPPSLLLHKPIPGHGGLTTFCAPPASPAASEALKIAIPLYCELSLPVTMDKVACPSTSIVYLGILFDSVRQELRLLDPKLSQLLHTLQLWARKKAATKRELQSLIGCLNHAAAVVRPGRTFMHHLIDTISIPKKQHYKVRLNQHCRANIAWWQLFVQGWNSVAFFHNPQVGTSVVADASKLMGMRSLLSRHTGMVPAPMAAIMGPDLHRHKRAAPAGCGRCPVGLGMERNPCSVTV